MAVNGAKAGGLPVAIVGVDLRLAPNWDHPDILSPDAIERVVATGAAGVELVVDERHATVSRLLDARPRALPLLQAAGLSPFSLVTDLLWRYNPATQSADVRGHALRVLRDLCRVAADYGIPAVVVLAGMQEPGTLYEATYAAAIQTLGVAARYATEYGVSIAVENAPTNFLQSPREFAGFIRDVGSPAVRACVNLNHVLVARQTFPENWILALGDCLALVRAYSEGAHVPAPFPEPGVDALDWPTCLAALRMVGYGGALTIGLPPAPLLSAAAAPDVTKTVATIAQVRGLGGSTKLRRGASP